MITSARTIWVAVRCSDTGEHAGATFELARDGYRGANLPSTSPAVSEVLARLLAAVWETAWEQATAAAREPQP